LWVVMDSNHRS